MGIDLRPRVRGVHNGMKKVPQYASALFPTNLGLRKVPRQKSALRPGASMIKNARQGLLLEFFRSGQIIRASDLGSMVDPKSAVLSLTDSVEMETDHLSGEAERIPENERTLENLFYICVEKDELPSYHFWRDKEDPDPLPAQDWNHAYRSNTVLEKETTAPAEYEQARKKATKDASWRPQGVLASFPYYKRNQRNLQVSGQLGPLPGNPEWEKVESAWEQRLDKYGLERIMRDLKSDHPEQYRELIHGKKSSVVKPARGDDEYDHQYNKILKTMVPTVAFKLTQQNFGRPISPLNFQEPLVQGANPKGLDLQGEAAYRFDTSYEVLQHEAGDLEFLDFYDEKSNGEFILRSEHLA